MDIVLSSWRGRVQIAAAGCESQYRWLITVTGPGAVPNWPLRKEWRGPSKGTLQHCSVTIDGVIRDAGYDTVWSDGRVEQDGELVGRQGPMKTEPDDFADGGLDWIGWNRASATDV